MTPTKADPLKERMSYTFGQRRIDRCFADMISGTGCDLLDFLTDDAREELLRRCITSHRLQRKFAAESRRLHKARVA